MSPYQDLPDEERRRLYEELTQAVNKINIDQPATGRAPDGAPGRGASGSGAPAPGAPVSTSPQGTALSFSSGGRYRRPSWGLRLRIDTYAYGQGFLICGFKQFLASIFSVFKSNRDLVDRRFVKALLLDNPYKSDPSGYSLSRALAEIRQTAEMLISGGFFLKRAGDRSQSLGRDLKQDLKTWEPFGYQFLDYFAHRETGALTALEYIRRRYESVEGIDVFDLVDIVKAVYRATLVAEVPFEIIKERLIALGKEEE